MSQSNQVTQLLTVTRETRKTNHSSAQLANAQVGVAMTGRCWGFCPDNHRGNALVNFVSFSGQGLPWGGMPTLPRHSEQHQACRELETCARSGSSSQSRGLAIMNDDTSNWQPTLCLFYFAIVVLVAFLALTWLKKKLRPVEKAEKRLNRKPGRACFKAGARRTPLRCKRKRIQPILRTCNRSHRGGDAPRGGPLRLGIRPMPRRRDKGSVRPMRCTQIPVYRRFATVRTAEAASSPRSQIVIMLCFLAVQMMTVGQGPIQGGQVLRGASSGHIERQFEAPRVVTIGRRNCDHPHCSILNQSEPTFLLSGAFLGRPRATLGISLKPLGWSQLGAAIVTTPRLDFEPVGTHSLHGSVDDESQRWGSTVVGSLATNRALCMQVASATIWTARGRTVAREGAHGEPIACNCTLPQVQWFDSRAQHKKEPEATDGEAGVPGPNHLTWINSMSI